MHSWSSARDEVHVVISTAQFGTSLHWLHADSPLRKYPGLHSKHACSPVRVHQVAPAAQLARSTQAQFSVPGQCVVDERMAPVAGGALTPAQRRLMMRTLGRSASVFLGAWDGVVKPQSGLPPGMAAASSTQHVGASINISGTQLELLQPPQAAAPQQPTRPVPPERPDRLRMGRAAAIIKFRGDEEKPADWCCAMVLPQGPS